MVDRPDLLAELKRRNVLRAGAFYVAAVWALAQGIAQLSAPFGLPDWITRWFVAACVIGFPFWIAFAWFYELTPTGLKRENQVRPEDSIAQHTGRKFDRWIIAALMVAVVLLATNTFVLRRDATSSARGDDARALAATLARLPQKSVAVLPLANESGDPDQQYFSDGLSEELISALTQIDGLKVIGKYSSFRFRDSKDSLAQIGATLGVAHLIQGSVRQQGERIRVIVGMTRVADGSSVWSRTYDDQLKDVFAIQTQIGQAVAGALKVRLLGLGPGMDDKPPSGNVQAYKLMLQGRAIARHGTEASYHRGAALYRQAVELDPDYAYAWGGLSITWINLGLLYLNGEARESAWASARVTAGKQQSLAPDSAATHITRGYLLEAADHDIEGALAEYQRAYALAPNDGTVMNFLSAGLRSAGQLQPAIALFRKAVATDPLRTDFHANLGYTLYIQGQFDAGEQAIRNALALQPDFPDLNFYLATISVARGQLDEAEQLLRRELALHPDTPGLHSGLAQLDILRGDAAAATRNASNETDPDSGRWIRVAVQQVGANRRQADAALHEYLTEFGKEQPYSVAGLYGLRKQPDEMFDWLQRARTQRDPQLLQNLLVDPFVLPYRHDPRFAALCQQLDLPLAAEAPSMRPPGQPAN